MYLYAVGCPWGCLIARLLDFKTCASFVDQHIRNIKGTTENLTCPVCRQLFNNARFLPCYHFYCEQCLEGMQVQSRITCPECRTEATVPLGGVKHFRSNSFVNRLVEELVSKCTKEGDEEVQCDNCDENDPVVAYCPSCSLFLCEICHSYHKRDRSTRNHGVIVLSEISTNPNQSIIKALQCRAHGSNELQYYCETCDELICMYCTVKEHNGHKHDTVKKMAGEFRHKMNESIGIVESKVQDLSKQYRDIKLMIDKINDEESEINKKIDCHYATLVEEIMEQKYQIKQHVHTTLSQKKKAFTMKLEEISSLQIQSFATKELHDSVKRSGDEMLLYLQKQVTANTKELMEACNKLTSHPVESDTMQFFPGETSLPQFSQVLSEVDPGESELSNLPRYIFQDTPVKLTITAKYSNGCCYPRGGNDISIQAQLQSELGNTEKIDFKVVDNKNGTYTVGFTAKQVGKLKVSVFLDGKQIKDSPYNTTVSKNYPAVNRPTNIVKIINHNITVAKPWGIAFGNNHVWAVADWTNHSISVFHKEDQLLWKFDTKCDGPCGIAFDKNNCLYVTDYNNHRVRKFDINGNFILQFTGNESGDGCLKTPVDVTVHEEKVYVADSTENCIVKFYCNGQFCQVIGKGHLNNPNGVAVNCTNHLLVTNLTDNSVYIFTLDGQYLGNFRALGPAMGHLSGPRSITTDLNGFILVTDTGNDRIVIFDKDGKFVHCFGSKGNRNSQFVNPRGIALAPNGSIYVSDTLNNCIKIFKI